MPLENLLSTGVLSAEAPDQQEFDGLVGAAKFKLADSQGKGLSDESRFTLAYSAAHGLALAAMRWHGYRPAKRYIVFQSLEQTVGLENAKWRVLDQCHTQRNLAEYQGQLEIPPELLRALTEVTQELLSLVEALGPVKPP